MKVRGIISFFVKFPLPCSSVGRAADCQFATGELTLSSGEMNFAEIHPPYRTKS